jgi:hypothetical protein
MFYENQNQPNRYNQSYQSNNFNQHLVQMTSFQSYQPDEKSMIHSTIRRVERQINERQKIEREKFKKIPLISTKPRKIPPNLLRLDESSFKEKKTINVSNNPCYDLGPRKKKTISSPNSSTRKTCQRTQITQT